MQENHIVVSAPPQISLDSNIVFADDDISNNQLTVTRERCLNPSLVDSFLSLLRHGTDDLIKQRMSTYGRAGGNGSYPEEKCDQFLAKELYPNWLARDQVLGFCEDEMKQMRSQLSQEYGEQTSLRQRPRVDSRVDPYAARNQSEELEAHFAKVQRLQIWLGNHRQVESILRSNSDRVLRSICDQNANYIKQFWKFQQEH
ncbi:YBL107C [Zygosaccharomyces parabailii]|uniref:ZYBA0S06-04060g1_1 n=1 Tax=Zygosaccharomyces bailii (strain CLIB 213 / ATCC 58445 / CBS 680 / BCRC 21525 / NBRC 1098 / NCYC 1416 / NRRL Y-2227) TaxID=1333698 RepID=A0A8J2T7D3_ZYGB2|nr:YBL107C [Zygosaccharomyces parabailii]CDF90243.1 ZYBA0S06-04060g1_1 [Zygosaccharomyces bailii CLIB 213]CDH11532.1 uncharacterized protein ZBAI_03318 [Zygosaccharomyces bailii ISA1307]SJM84592.1 related to Mic23p [Zygosaccharomyces bailii]